MSHSRVPPIVFFALGVVALSGCVSRDLQEVPKDLVTEARIEDFPGVRDFADCLSPMLQASLVESFRQDREAGAGEADPAPISILALSGGGADGAYGAGLLCGWSAAGTRPTFKLVTGVSTGALIAPFVFVGPDKDDALKRIYTTISSKDVYRRKSLLEALIDGDALCDTAPLEHLIAREIDEPMLERVAAAHRAGRRLFVGTTNIDTGTFVIWDMGAIAASGRPDALRLFRDVLRASSSIPIAFPLSHYVVETVRGRFEERHGDGGVCAGVFFLGFALDWTQAQRDAGTEPRPANLYVIRNGKLTSVWALMLGGGEPHDPPCRGLIGASIVGDLYRIYSIATREHIAFNLASIPEDFVPNAHESFDRVEMNRLFDLGFKSAGTGYDWQPLPPGLRPPTAPDAAGPANPTSTFFASQRP